MSLPSASLAVGYKMHSVAPVCFVFQLETRDMPGPKLENCNHGTSVDQLEKCCEIGILASFFGKTPEVHIKALGHGTCLAAATPESSPEPLPPPFRMNFDGIKGWVFLSMPNRAFAKLWNQTPYEWCMFDGTRVQHAFLNLACRPGDSMCMCVDSLVCIYCETRTRQRALLQSGKLLTRISSI